MIKLYIVWDSVSNNYFSEVAGKIRVRTKEHTYIYDRKHASKVLRDVLKSQELTEPHNLMLREVSVDDVPITDYSINRTWTSKIRNGYPFLKALRLCKLEHVRKFNDYVNFDTQIPSHKYRYLTEIISTNY